MGCQPEKPVAEARPAKEKANSEPKRVMVQHCLISFEGEVPNVTRTKEEAQLLAEKLFADAKAGADFNEIVKQYTNDSAPGIYKMVNSGLQADGASGTSSRDGMVKGFGDVSFSLKVDEYGLCPYDPATSKFGWHIIKRLE
jgi:parvulin-like peptidyl-prolyl isomerase